MVVSFVSSAYYSESYGIEWGSRQMRLVRVHVDACLARQAVFILDGSRRPKSPFNIRMLSKALSKVQERKAVEYVEDSFMEITSAFKKRSASMRSANSENTEIVREQLRTFHDETSNSHSIY